MAYIFIISTPTKDRHNTVTNSNGWELENYKRNPIVFWAERALFGEDNPDMVIGTSRIWMEGDKLMAEWIPDQSSETAAKLEKKLKSGTTLGASVNFISLGGSYGKGAEAKDGKNETWYFKGQELLSWKITTIPSNPDCIYQKNYISVEQFERIRKMRALEIRRKQYLGLP